MPTIWYRLATDSETTHLTIIVQWDLGEFSQKGSVATRWGTKSELVQACQLATKYGIDVLIDAVLNVTMSSTLYNRSNIFAIYEA